MGFEWIDNFVNGVIEYCNSDNIYEILDVFDITVKRVGPGDFMLQGYDAIYIRNYLGYEIIFIRDDIPCKLEKFILCHELGHAVLHVELLNAAYRSFLVNGKFEKQADYFACKLLDIKLNEVDHHGLTLEQISKDLCINKESLERIREII